MDQGATIPEGINKGDEMTDLATKIENGFVNFLNAGIGIFTDVKMCADTADAANVQADETTIINAAASGGVSFPGAGLYQAMILKEGTSISAASGAVLDILQTMKANVQAQLAAQEAADKAAAGQAPVGGTGTGVAAGPGGVGDVVTK